ncbi:carboxypeptidase regulatory-like domain-containing protein [Leeuwenhoekiella nanhaiensis]|uniref:Fibronectin type-III domain-containing protein n=1 Tax=Leeuwenhoekiella nanhaiensis TaxID=1655491 RepID=A0A2G1VT61_9FLAO|nr:carboxypeptidase regulatory-like domain-containing protein [Leeuwenhoekiella nanhaiensis]PHQ29639.1 hypothetical protein CJ305_09765 [Leeuwenhoekiella nanhaiensis]
MKIKYIVHCFVLLLAISCTEDPIGEFGTGTITGKVVTEGENLPLENVKISSNPVSNTVFTDADGNFTITDVEAGQYSVQAELDGYVTAFEASQVEEGRVNNIVFELEVSTVNNEAPLAPELVSPADTSEELASEVTFLWTSGANDEDNLSYVLELRNISQNSIERFENLTDTTYTVSDLDRGTSYVWQIIVSDEINEPVRSETAQFSTEGYSAKDYHFARIINSNAVIFSSSEDGSEQVALTDFDQNSFRPRKNAEVGKIAFLRTVGGNTHLFTMNLDGSEQKQLTQDVPVNGFRISDLDFTWAQNGSKIYYPHFDKLYSINFDGSGRTLIYKTDDGSFISEVAAADFDDNLIVIKTNNNQGYNARIFTVSLSSQSVVDVILENEPGAAGGLDIDANANRVIFSRDISGSENDSYRIFRSRLFIYDINTQVTNQIIENTPSGKNDLDPSFSPTEGAVIFTRVSNNTGAVPEVFKVEFASSSTNPVQLLFTNAFMPDWE